jgi:hypothetical protein
MKRCCDCKQLKPLEDFWLHKKDGTKRQVCCKICGNKRMAVYRETHKKEIRIYYQLLWAKRGLREKVWWFRRNGRPYLDPLLTLENVKKKFGDNPVCYLTGTPIDLNNRDAFSLDHIIPLSRGGLSSLENCGLATLQANQFKRDMTPQEFWDFCATAARWRES